MECRLFRPRPGIDSKGLLEVGSYAPPPPPGRPPGTLLSGPQVKSQGQKGLISSPGQRGAATRDCMWMPLRGSARRPRSARSPGCPSLFSACICADFQEVRTDPSSLPRCVEPHCKERAKKGWGRCEKHWWGLRAKIRIPLRRVLGSISCSGVAMARPRNMTPKDPTVQGP